MARGAGEIARALDRADPAIRCYLLYGPDEAGSRALAARLAPALGPDAERIDLSPAQLKSDPTLLADEAASRSLFGGARHIRVDGANDDCLVAVEALLAAGVAGNPVVLIGGTLKKDSKLVRCVAGSPAGRVHQSYPPEGQDAERLVIEAGRALGLLIERDVAQRLALACNADRALLSRELEKLALFLDALPGAARTLDHAALDTVGVDAGEADTSHLLDALFGGDERALDRHLSRACMAGTDGIVMVRAALRRTLGLAAARADMESGTPTEAAVARHLFGRDRQAAGRHLAAWPALRLRALMERLALLERELKASRGPGPIVADQLFMTVARRALR